MVGIILFSLTILLQLFLLVSVLHLIYRKNMYDSRVNEKRHPQCSIILPCKGTPLNFKENIESFCKLDYPNYEVLFTVESESDPAVKIIKEVTKEHNNSNLIVAGYSTKCAQKNHNLIAAVKKVSNPEILLFADSDIKLFPNWIETMITPLEDKKNTAVTGFRWLYSTSKKLGPIAHSFQNFILFSLFSIASSTTNVGVWGGSMALRKKDFDNLGVARAWSRASGDDMCLSQLLKKKKKKVHLSFDCITPTTDTLDTFKDAVVWYKRQVQYMKFHQKIEWFSAVFASIIYLFVYLSLPFALFRFTVGDSFWINGGFIFAFQVITTILISSLFPLIGKSKHTIFFAILSPISLLSVVFGVMGSVFTNTMYWSGIKYKIRFKDGVVTEVTR